MHSSVAIGVSALTVLSSFQLCPAPPVVIAAAITAGGAIIGGAISTAGHKVRRDGSDDLPPGVPKEQYDQCVNELTAANVVVNGPIGNNGIQADGVPPTCMTLATVIAGNPVDGPYPTPCGSACLLYDNLNSEQYQKLADIFSSHQG